MAVASMWTLKKEAGRRLRDARNAQNLTLREVSERTNGQISPSRLSNYEQGLRMLKAQEALVLAPALGVNAPYLLCVEEGDMTTEELELLRNWRALPENERKQYARRIGVLALAYREPIPDERVERSIQAPKPKKRHKQP